MGFREPSRAPLRCDEMDVLQLTNGHDFLAMLGLALKHKFGKRLGSKPGQCTSGTAATFEAARGG
jgi:hypothetical protein